MCVRHRRRLRRRHCCLLQEIKAYQRLQGRLSLRWFRLRRVLSQQNPPLNHTPPHDAHLRPRTAISMLLELPPKIGGFPPIKLHDDGISSIWLFFLFGGDAHTLTCAVIAVCVEIDVNRLIRSIFMAHLYMCFPSVAPSPFIRLSPSLSLCVCTEQIKDYRALLEGTWMYSIMRHMR